MNFVPALTSRAVLATPEHAIPYQLGYYRQIHNRLAATLQAISTPDPKVLQAYLNGYGVDYLLAERPTLATGVIPGRYPHILPAESASAAIALKERPSAVAAAIPGCARYTGAILILLDGKCLARPPIDGLRPHDPAP